MSKDFSDGELMLRLQEGDSRALNELMRRWQVPLRRFLQRCLQNENDALDVAQEAFLRVYQHRARFRAGACFSTWLFGIALNLGRNELRRRRSRPTQPLVDEADRVAAITFCGGTTAPSMEADAALLRSEAISAVRQAVGNLPGPLSSPLILCTFEGFSQRDAAEVVGCSSKAIEMRLHRARGMLRKSLERYLGKC